MGEFGTLLPFDKDIVVEFGDWSMAKKDSSLWTSDYKGTLATLCQKESHNMAELAKQISAIHKGLCQLEHKVEGNLEFDQMVYLSTRSTSQEEAASENQDLLGQMRKLRVHWLFFRRTR